jgi:4-hydroxy-tetrahydrodipicolinate reductase
MRTADQPIRISLTAPNGRMGKALANAVADKPEFTIDQDHADILVDFSAPDALEASLDRAIAANLPILVGTTGLQPEHHEKIAEAAGQVAIIYAPNTSLGINLLRQLVEEATARLGPDWDIEILEMHHRHKVDAPSGPARALGRAAAAGRGADFDHVAKRVRDGITGARKRGDIGFAVLRGGDVVSDHRVIFASEGERVELTHIATSREIYARGALRAALWAQDKPPGLYSMANVLGLTG